MNGSTLTIGEAARLALTTPGALRMAERRGTLPPPARDARGWRKYDGTMVSIVLDWRDRLEGRDGF
jgi:DNA-binding transcriptional MerR regulator